MDKQLRFKQEMFVRVRDFGVAHRERFPESSTGGELLSQVAAVVTAIDDQLQDRLRGQAEGRRVKPLTRKAVYAQMKTIARAGRRVTRGERGAQPFRLPRLKTLKVQIAAGRVFVDEVRRRQADFTRYGLSPDYISAFEARVEELARASDTRISSRNGRGWARAGLRTAVKRGLDLVRDLDVVIDAATEQDSALAEAWRVARHIDGRGTSPRTAGTTAPAGPPAEVPTPSPVDELQRAS